MSFSRSPDVLVGSPVEYSADAGQSPASNAYNELDSNQARLAHLIDVLRDKLQPVLFDGKANSAVAEPAPAKSSPLVDAIRNQSTLTREHCRRIEAMLDSLTI